ncbi:MAG: DUF2007 domain-containing protein [Actinomycetota bacterium]
MSADSTDHRPPVVIGTYADTGEAEITRAHLRANGIESAIVDDVEGGVLPVDTQGGVMVAVHAADEDRARAVLTGTD